MSDKIIVALSGGVDSSVAALLLQRAGHRVEALFMKNWNEPTDSGRCRWEDDVADALAVCEVLKIPLNTVDLSREYWTEVFRHFVTEYQAGRTPNPDVLCNREIKFKAFLDHARNHGAASIATGHYAHIGQDGPHYTLCKGADAGKDQSYFLYTLGQTQLAATRFPVGQLQKSEVRRMARMAGLRTHDKRDSTGICFIGQEQFREFLGRYVPAQPGPIHSADGATIGEHQGVFYYTLGQREGLRIGGVRGAAEAPWYVIDKDVGANTLIVAQGHDHPALMSAGLAADTLSWVAGDAPGDNFRCRAKIRYRQADQACSVALTAVDRCEVRFDLPQRAVTPGQSVVFYDGAHCLGGGVIAQRFR